MLKSLLTKKLYQFSVVFYFVFILYNSSTNVSALIKDSSSTCWYPDNNEVQIIEANAVDGLFKRDGSRILGGTNSGNGLLYRIPSDMNRDPKRWTLCIEIPTFTVTTTWYNTIPVYTYTSTGRKKYFPFKESLIDQDYKICTDNTNFCAFQDTVYDDLTQCIDDKKRNSQFVYSEETEEFYGNLTACRNAEANATPNYGTADLTRDGNCYYMQTGKAYQTIAGSPPEEIKCSCYTGSWLKQSTIWLAQRTSLYGIFIPSDTAVYYGQNVFGDQWLLGGPEKQYNRSSDINENIRQCQTENPERYYSTTSKKCYRDLDQCKFTSICTIDKDKHLFVVKSSSNYRSYDTASQQTKIDELKNCAALGKTNDECLARVYGPETLNNMFYRCNCEKPWTCGIIPGASCDKACGLDKTPAPDFKVIAPITISSPLALINVVVNFLFWLAVAIFVINILSASLDYIKGGDQPDKLKEASDRITGTIFGFIFLLVASGVINFIISRIKEFGL